MRKALLYLTEFASEIYAKLHAGEEVKDTGYHISLGLLVVKKCAAFSPCLSATRQQYE